MGMGICLVRIVGLMMRGMMMTLMVRIRPSLLLLLLLLVVLPPRLYLLDPLSLPLPRRKRKPWPMAKSVKPLARQRQRQTAPASERHKTIAERARAPQTVSSRVVANGPKRGVGKVGRMPIRSACGAAVPIPDQTPRTQKLKAKSKVGPAKSKTSQASTL